MKIRQWKENCALLFFCFVFFYVKRHVSRKVFDNSDVDFFFSLRKKKFCACCDHTIIFNNSFYVEKARRTDSYKTGKKIIPRLIIGSMTQPRFDYKKKGYSLYEYTRRRRFPSTVFDKFFLKAKISKSKKKSNLNFRFKKDRKTWEFVAFDILFYYFFVFLHNLLHVF